MQGDSASAAVRVVVHFILGLKSGDLSAPHLALGRQGGWRQPDVTRDLGVQPYDNLLLDSLVEKMPQATCELHGLAHFGLASPAHVEDHGCPILANPGPRDDPWRPVDARLTWWNVGAGLLELVYDLPPASGSSPANMVAAVSPRVVAMYDAVVGVVREVISTSDAAWPAAQVGLLWANTLYIVQLASTTSPPEWSAIAEAITPVGKSFASPLENGAVLRVGRNSCYVGGRLDSPAAAVLTQLAGAHQVCWAAALLLDAQVARELVRLRPDGEHVTLPGLKESAETTLLLYHRTRSFRLRYDSVEAHLDLHAAAVWRTIESEWNVRSVLQTLDSRVDFLSKLHAQLSAALQGRRSEVLNELVLAFTFLSIFSIIIASLTFIVIDDLTVQTYTVVWLGISLSITAAAYLIYRVALSRR